MSRKLRFIPDGGALVEVTCRTVQGRLLLAPSPQLNEIILGVLGRAQRLYPVEIVGYVFVSSHWHGLLRVDNAKQLSDFVGYFNSNLAKEIGRRTGWREKVWGRRYQAIVISDEEEVQVARLRYVVSHGVKEGLVGRVEEWPGVHCAVPLMTGAAVEGTWFDRTREYNARLRGKELEKGESASTEVVVLSPLPCWGHLTPEVYRGRIREMVREIDEAAAAARAESLIPPLGADGVRAQNPETRPRRIKKSPAPFFHALRKAVRQGLWEAYGACGLPGCGRAVAGGGPQGCVPGGELPAWAAVRGGLRWGRRPGGVGGRWSAAKERIGRTRVWGVGLAGGRGVLGWLVKCCGDEIQLAEVGAAGGRRGGVQVAEGGREGGELGVLADRSR